jgi:hypothetical protein
MSTCSKKKAILKKEVAKKQDGKGGGGVASTAPGLAPSTWRPEIDDSSTKELIRNTERMRAAKKAPVANALGNLSTSLASPGSGAKLTFAMKDGVHPNLNPHYLSGSPAGKTLNKFTVPGSSAESIKNKLKAKQAAKSQFSASKPVKGDNWVPNIGTNFEPSETSTNLNRENSLSGSKAKYRETNWIVPPSYLRGSKARRVTSNRDLSPKLQKEKG